MSTNTDNYYSQLYEAYGEYAFYMWKKGGSLGDAMADAMARKDGSNVSNRILTEEQLRAQAVHVETIKLSDRDFRLHDLNRNAKAMSRSEYERKYAALKKNDSESKRALLGNPSNPDTTKKEALDSSDSEELDSIDLSDSDSDLIQFSTFVESNQLPVSELSMVEPVKLPENIYTRADLRDSSSSDSESDEMPISVSSKRITNPFIIPKQTASNPFIPTKKSAPNHSIPKNPTPNPYIPTLKTQPQNLSNALFKKRVPPVKSPKTAGLRQRKPTYSHLLNDQKPSNTNEGEVKTCCQTLKDLFQLYNK